MEDLSANELNQLKDANIIGADPGKYNLIFMADKDGNKLRYTAFQRRTESLAKRNHRMPQTLEFLKCQVGVLNVQRCK